MVDLVRQNGFADADAWRANWEAAWKVGGCIDGGYWWVVEDCQRLWCMLWA